MRVGSGQPCESHQRPPVGRPDLEHGAWTQPGDFLEKVAKFPTGLARPDHDPEGVKRVCKVKHLVNCRNVGGASPELARCDGSQDRAQGPRGDLPREGAPAVPIDSATSAGDQGRGGESSACCAHGGDISQRCMTDDLPKGGSYDRSPRQTVRPRSRTGAQADCSACGMRRRGTGSAFAAIRPSSRRASRSVQMQTRAKVTTPDAVVSTTRTSAPAPVIPTR